MIHISLAAEKIAQIGSWPITNSMLTTLVGSILLVFLFWLAARKVSLHPTSNASLTIELIVESLLDLIEQVTHSRHKAVRYLPLLATLFLFIVVNNWLGLLPGIGSVFITTPEGRVPLFRPANADLNTTLALALISVVVTQAYAIKALGLFRHLGKYFSLNPMLLFVGLIELISEFSKMISFSFRLFGNIFAGEVLLGVISYLAPLGAPLPFLAFELFIGLIQGLVFTILTLVFLETATTPHDNHADVHTISHSTPDDSLTMKKIASAEPSLVN
jgi:F-type H+-transporting ATPase subunit a